MVRLAMWWYGTVFNATLMACRIGGALPDLSRLWKR